MAITPCSECHKEISDKATACPHCGNPINTAPAVKIVQGDRKCLSCGYIGPMYTWQRNNIAPQFIALILLMLYILPGLIFIAWAWGKYKCPNCNAIDKNVIAK